MPHKDDPDGEGLSEVSFTEPTEDDEEEEGDVLHDLSDGLRRLHIKKPTAQRRISINVSSAPTQRSSRERSGSNFQTDLMPGREDEPAYTAGSSSECAPMPRGWSRAFPSRP